MKIVFLDAATMGDADFAPVEKLGTLIRYDNSTPQEAKESFSDLYVLSINKIQLN